MAVEFRLFSCLVFAFFESKEVFSMRNLRNTSGDPIYSVNFYMMSSRSSCIKLWVFFQLKIIIFFSSLFVFSPQEYQRFLIWSLSSQAASIRINMSYTVCPTDSSFFYDWKDWKCFVSGVSLTNLISDSTCRTERKWEFDFSYLSVSNYFLLVFSIDKYMSLFYLLEVDSIYLDVLSFNLLVTIYFSFSGDSTPFWALLTWLMQSLSSLTVFFMSRSGSNINFL